MRATIKLTFPVLGAQVSDWRETLKEYFDNQQDNQKQSDDTHNQVDTIQPIAPRIGLTH
jgi:hypothetical protein